MDTHKVNGYIIHTWGVLEKANYLAKKYQKFTCNACGCFFEADCDHYEVYSQRNEMFYKALCPCCKRRVYSYE